MVKPLTVLAAAAVVGVGGLAAYTLLKKSGGGGGGTYSVSVVVEGPNGAFPGALVQLAGQTSTTDISGAASFAGVPGGPALLSVSATGFPLVQKNVMVGPSSTFFSVSLAQQACQPQSCPCGEVFDTVLCKCSPLVPAGLLISPSQTVSLSWKVSINCITQAKQIGLIPAGNVCTDQISPTIQVLTTVSGTVVDDHSHPICGVPVDIALSDTDVAWNDGHANGRMTFSVNPHDVTDANGNFSVDVVLTMSVTGYNGDDCLPFPFGPLGGATSGQATQVLSVTVRVSGTLIQQAAVITYSNSFCEFFFP